MLLSTKSFIVVVGGGGFVFESPLVGVFVFYYFCVPSVGASLLSTPTLEVHLWRTDVGPLEHSPNTNSQEYLGIYLSWRTLDQWWTSTKVYKPSSLG